MYFAAAEIRFNASHHLMLPNSIEEPDHHHQWKVQAVVQADRLDANGLVIDFHRLQRLLKKITAPFEQAPSINTLDPFTTGNPSTERIARFIFDQLAPLLPKDISIAEVTLWETPDCWAACKP